MKIRRILGILAGVTAIILGVVFLTNSDTNKTNLPSAEPVRTTVNVPEGFEVATFGTGCFWCMESAFQETPGITSAVSGYAGGTIQNPTYEQVYTMQTDHRESVQVLYDPEIITYSEVLDVFWRGIDPTDDGGQFVDRGFAYTTAVFYHTSQQRDRALESIKQLELSGRYDGKEIVTPVIEFTTFYEAEEYHQDFYLKSPERYVSYEAGSGREEYREFVWSEIQKQEAEE